MPPRREMNGIRNGQDTMSKRICVRCKHFSPACMCVEKPTWGHCMWAASGDKAEDDPQGRFTWADATCEHFTARRAVAARS